MARRHWLDPLARKVLQAIGDLPPDPVRAPAASITKAEAPGLSIDVNRATASDWRQLPGCTDAMVDLLLRLQQGGVQFSQLEDLARLLELPPSLSNQWRKHLVFRWHGDAPPLPERAPLDLNASSSSLLAASLKWPEERLQRLISERRRQPFQHLADLQERLCLPPDAVEALAARACAANGPAGRRSRPRSPSALCPPGAPCTRRLNPLGEPPRVRSGMRTHS